METVQQVATFVGANLLALGIGVTAGFIIENVVGPVSKVRAKLKSLLGKAEDAL